MRSLLSIIKCLREKFRVHTRKNMKRREHVPENKASEHLAPTVSMATIVVSVVKWKKVMTFQSKQNCEIITILRWFWEGFPSYSSSYFVVPNRLTVSKIAILQVLPSGYFSPELTKLASKTAINWFHCHESLGLWFRIPFPWIMLFHI